MVAALHVDGLVPIGQGIDRPEQVLVGPDGRVFASDKQSAVAEITDGGLRRIGSAGGEPNGIAMTPDGKVLIANFGSGSIQEVDLERDTVRAIVTSESVGRAVTWMNFVLVDRHGDLWASCSTASPDLLDAITSAKPDGFLIRARADGSDPVVVAEKVNFPNSMALDQDEDFLYVVRTTPAGVVRFPIRADRSLGPGEQFGPDLGGRRPDEVGPDVLGAMQDPETMRRWGMADGSGFDAAGNLWVTIVGPNRVVAITPDREIVSVIEDPLGELVRSPTSVAWGGEDMRDVYIGSIEAPYVLRGRSSVSGMRLLHQRRVGDTQVSSTSG